MKQLLITLLLLSPPAMAQTPAPADGLDQGLSLMEQGAQMLLEHMMGKVEPSLQDMTEALKQAQPKIMELLAMMEDITRYHPPEKLPNGDILIRRKSPAELKLESLQGGDTEL